MFLDGAKEGDSLMLKPDASWKTVSLDSKRSRACAVTFSVNKVAFIGGRKSGSNENLVHQSRL